VLKPGGKLLYATCSVFPEENGAQIDAFLVRQPAARRWPKKNSCPRKNMTDSFMPVAESCLAPWIFALLLFASSAQAADISVRNPTLARQAKTAIRCRPTSTSISMPPRRCHRRGVTLYFVVDFELSRSRWYWLDEQVASRSQTYQLSYHALTRQYRLSSGALHQSFTSLDDAQRILSRLRNWQVIDKGVARRIRPTSPPFACAST
jgi:hypothetical protein